MTKEIYLAGGCFWGTQHYIKQIKGIINTQAGYANGHTSNPTYQEVYTDNTGYTETVKVVYNPSFVSLNDIIRLYFHSIDPTLINRQGGDIGTRYRTGIYYTDINDLTIISDIYDKVAQSLDTPIAVELEPLKNFYAAEEYHQDYLDKNPNGYCHIPKSMIEWLRKEQEAK